MRPERTFQAERALARHCPELLRAGPSGAELLARLERAAAGIARALGPGLAPLCQGEAPVVGVEAPREIAAAELEAEIAPLAGNALFALPAGAAPLLVSVEAGAVLRLVDRAFGGKGVAPSPLPEAFPPSAELMLARLEGLLGDTIGAALGMALEPLRRDGSLVELAPFDADARLALATFDVAEHGASPWSISIALPFEALAALFGHERRAPPLPRAAGPHPADAPFGDLPLTVTATLVDMRMPVAALAALEPGMVLPVSVARSAPLAVAGRTIAHGAIGAQDERVAVQLTHAF